MATSAHKLMTKIAMRYLDAAIVLHKNSPAPNALWEPLNHLFSMSFELALKAYLERVGVTEKELRKQNFRHSLHGLLLMAVEKGLRTTCEEADVVLEMDEAHASHAYRYVPRPADGEVATVYSAHPAVAFAAIQRLLDQCAEDPAELRAKTNFPEEWPPASLPVHPVTAEQLDVWRRDKLSLREFAASSQKRKRGVD